MQPQAPFAHRLAYCGSPIYGHIQNERLLEWIEYHRVTHGVDFFHLYDAGGVDQTLRLRLKPYMSAKVMDVRDAREINKFETWMSAQVRPPPLPPAPPRPLTLWLPRSCW